MKPVGSGAYMYIHKQIVIRLVYFSSMMINAVPAAKGISDKFSPREIVTGCRLNLKHLKAPFGKYLEAIVDADDMNDIRGRTYACNHTGAIFNSLEYAQLHKKKLSR